MAERDKRLRQKRSTYFSHPFQVCTGRKRVLQSGIVTVPEALALAIQHHRAGRLAEAEGLYRQILSVEQQHADAWHLLGVVAHQAGRSEAAVEMILRAIGLQPTSAVFYFNLGKAYDDLGRRDEAVEAYRRAVELNPAFHDARNHLGNALAARGQLDEAVATYRQALQMKPDFAEVYHNLALVLSRQGQHDEALMAFRRAIQCQPNYVDAHNNLGIALQQRGFVDEAIAAHTRAIELRPDDAKAHNYLGRALAARGKLDEAMAAFHRAIQLEPDNADAHNNLGSVFLRRKKFTDALVSFRQAVQLDPNFPDAYNNLGIALAHFGELEEAIAAYRRALKLRPDFPEAHNHLSSVLGLRGQLDEALAASRRALELKPDSPEILTNVGNALGSAGSFVEAEEMYRRALRLDPSHLWAQNNLGNVLTEQGRLDEANAAFQRALELSPHEASIHRNLASVFKHQGLLEEAVTSYRRALALDPTNADAHASLVYVRQFLPANDSKSIATERLDWSRRFAGAEMRTASLPHDCDPDPDRRLRIGYVSPDFRKHVVGRNLLPLFACHDHKAYEIICYSDVIRQDELTGRFRERADQWRSTTGLTDAQLAELVRGDKVDVLVDLTQHLAGNRLRMFARKPAPVQVSFAGYPAGTGVEAIEYRISDRWLEGGEEGRMANAEYRTPERLFFIDSFWCYDPCGVDVAVNELPAKKNGAVTFGCLNNFCKVNEPLLALWARVLNRVKGSRLVILAAAGSHRQRTAEFLQRHGVGPQRVEFVPFCPRPEYLELYHRLDLVLDTFPYNGHTTSLDALWMGVPVITMAGELSVSRAGLSQLSNLGLPEFVARTEDDYVQIAEEWAADLQRLAQLRATLRQRTESSVLMDAPRFARQIEEAYRQMWGLWCSGRMKSSRE